MYYQKYLISLIVIFLNNSAVCGNLTQPLLTSSFKHPRLIEWLAQFPDQNPPSSGIPGQEGLGVLSTFEEKDYLLEAIDTLSNAHGFLVFKYEKYRLNEMSHEVFLQAVENDIADNYLYHGPHIIFLPKENQATGFSTNFIVRWNGYDEEFDLPTDEMTEIEMLTSQEARSKLESTNNILTSTTEGVDLFTDLLYDSKSKFYFVINDESYKNHDTTIYFCRQSTKIKIRAFGFPSETTWEGADSTKTRFAWIDPSVVTSSSGRMISASAKKTIYEGRRRRRKPKEIDIQFQLNIVIFELDTLQYYVDPAWTNLPPTLTGICDQTVLNVRVVSSPVDIPWDTSMINWSGAVAGTGVIKKVIPKIKFNDFMDTISVSVCSKNISTTISLQGMQFAQSPNQVYEYDDNKISYYNSFQTSPTAGIPWKFIPTEGVDYLSSTQQNAAGGVSLNLSDSINFSLSPNTTNQLSSELTLSATSSLLKSDLLASSDNECDLGIIKLASYDNTKEFNLAIIIVTEQSDDIQVGQGMVSDPSVVCVSVGPNGVLDTKPDSFDIIGVIQGDTVILAGTDSLCQTVARSSDLPPNFTNQASPINEDSIREALNKIYFKAGVNWGSVDLFTETINYDIDGDGWFETARGITNVYNLEQEAMINRCIVCKSDDFEDYKSILFFVDNTADQNDDQVNSYGIMDFDQKYGFIYPESADSTIQFYKTIAHELGHGAFDFRHPFYHGNDNPHDAPGYPEPPKFTGPYEDDENLMDYSPNGIRIRKYLLDYLHTPRQ